MCTRFPSNEIIRFDQNITLKEKVREHVKDKTLEYSVQIVVKFTVL